MLKLVVRSYSQRSIALLALGITLFFNITFFSKLFTYAASEDNYLIIFSAPLVLFLLLMLLLNLVLFPTHRLGFRVMLAFFIVVGTLCAYFIDTYGIVFDSNMYANMTQTDTEEVFDLITPKLLFYVFTALTLAFWVIRKAPIRFQSYTKELFQRAVVIVLLSVGITGIYVSTSKTYSSFFRNHHELKMYLNPYYPLASLGKFIAKNLKTKPHLSVIAADALKPEHAKKKLVVLVVGETARAQNFSLNGYEMPTNPLLSKRDDVVSFSNFHSCGTATAVSVPCLFSKFTREEWSSDKESYENLVDVLNKTGVRILWRDNNSGGDKDVAKRMQDVKKFNGVGFDDVLLQDFQASVDRSYQDTFIVLHQEGSHGPTYFKRYPDAFKRFTPTCDTQDLQKCTQEQIVNTYNNTLLYTDFILDKTISLLKANEDKYDTTLIYASDHGESLGENGIYLHGLPYMIAPDAQKHIPAIFYRPQKTLELKAKQNDAFSHDNLFHTILGLFEVQTKEYDAKLDMLR
ncbi:MAG: phosphoethanolamine--lipid A transferase [Sulfurospirillum cavolei]|nr:phosphoethanolamine--lipid A transferase [Sulfurospirillum cavolei]